MITKHTKLSREQLAEVEELVESCKIQDNAVIPYHPHILTQKRVFPSTVFYYENDKLIGFLSAFFFYKDKCEVAVMVHPEFRKQGIAKKMLQEVFHLFVEYHIRTLAFSVIHGTNFQEILASKNFKFLHSEYNMQRLSDQKQPQIKKFLKLTKGTINHLAFLTKVDHECFGNEILTANSRLKEILENKDYEIMILVLRNKFIGKAHIHYYKDKARLTDIGVLPEYQGKGYGSELLSLLINYLVYKKHFNICLEVEAKNEHALKLYTKVGFNITNVYDFWSIDTNNLGKIQGF